MENLSPAEEIVVLALKSGRTDEETSRFATLFSRVGDDAVWECAAHNKVLPVVGHVLGELPGLRAGDRWKRIHETMATKTRAYIAEMDQAAAALDAVEVKFATIEGGAIAASGMCCPGCFVSSDIELLVAFGDLGTVHEALLRLGYAKMLRAGRASDDPTRPDAAERGWSVYRKELPGGLTFWLNVMWVPVLRRWCPMHGELVMEDLLARAIPVRGRDTRLRVPCPEDFLMSCACHTASHSYVRDIGLRLQLDVDRIVRQTSIDWEIVISRCRSLGLCGTVFPALFIPKSLWDTPVPDAVLAELVPSSARRSAIVGWLAQASVFNRDQVKFGRLGFFLFETLLSDRGRGVAMWRALFPPREWMQRGYGFNSRLLLPFYHVRRLLDLARRRPV